MMQGGEMYEIKKNIFVVPGKRKSQFPYCCCLLVKGKNLSVLIDAGMGKEQMDMCLEKGFDVLFLTHCHVDHRLTIRHIPDKPVWCYEKEAPYIQDGRTMRDGMGYEQMGLDYEALFGHLILPDSEIQRTFTDGETADLGGLTLQVLHTPGHTPGHSSIYIPEENFLFAADVDLSPFGPMYGNVFSSIDEFISTIGKLKALGASAVATGHTRPYEDAIEERFIRFEAVIGQRDERILSRLDRPRPFEDFINQNIIYKSYPESQGVTEWFEMVHLQKQFERLLQMGKVRKEGDLFIKN